MGRAEQLILAGADVNARDEQTFSPLEYAAIEGHPGVVELLLARGADVNLRDEQGIVPLHLAATGGSTTVTQLLIEHGADVNAASNEGYTALHVAAMVGSVRVAEILIDHGADVNAENNYGRTPLNEALDAEHRRLSRLLGRHGGIEGENARLPFTPVSAYVVVDRSDPAFIVVTGLDQDTAADELDEIRQRAARNDDVTILAWDEFAASANEIAQSIVLVPEYPEFRVVDGFQCLVGTRPGSPWGLTWNGGIALTMNDYAHTRRRYELYTENPSRVRKLDPRGDPVNPGSFLMFFGCMF